MIQAEECRWSFTNAEGTMHCDLAVGHEGLHRRGEETDDLIEEPVSKNLHFAWTRVELEEGSRPVIVFALLRQDEEAVFGFTIIVWRRQLNVLWGPGE